MSNFQQPYILKLKTFFGEINSVLLLFLIAISNSSYTLKFAALIAVFCYFIFGKRIHFKKMLQVKNDKTTWFYLSLIFISIVNLFFNFSANYLLVVVVGIFLWLTNLLLHAETLNFIKQNSYEKTIKTLQTFVVLNFILALVNLFQVMLATKTLLPYSQIAPPPYGAMSGDFIKGFFRSEHLPNSCISALLFFYFTLNKRFKTALISLTTLLLASSNLFVLVLLVFLIPTFILNDKRVQYFVVLVFSFILIFYIKINPSNYSETLKTLKITKENNFEKKVVEKSLNYQDERLKMQNEIDSLSTAWLNSKLATNKHKAIPKIDTLLPKSEEAVISLLAKQNLKEHQLLESQTLTIWKERDSLKRLAEEKVLAQGDTNITFDLESTPGMLISLKQTKAFLFYSPKNFLLGNGMGNFSSALAFMSSKNTVSSRLFDFVLPYHEDTIFRENHEAIWKFVDYKGVDYHSVKHMPFNTYNTLLGEYGILGLLSLLLLYVTPLALKLRHNVKKAIILLPLFLIFLGFHYWFETFTFIVFFELLIHNEIKGNLKSSK